MGSIRDDFILPNDAFPYESIEGLWIVGQCDCVYVCPIALGETNCMYCGKPFRPADEVLAKVPAAAKRVVASQLAVLGACPPDSPLFAFVQTGGGESEAR